MYRTVPALRMKLRLVSSKVGISSPLFLVFCFCVCVCSCQTVIRRRTAPTEPSLVLRSCVSLADFAALDERLTSRYWRLPYASSSTAAHQPPTSPTHCQHQPSYAIDNRSSPRSAFLFSFPLVRDRGPFSRIIFERPPTVHLDADNKSKSFIATP